jgi:hypothetical protein
MFTNNDVNILNEKFDEISNEISRRRANMFGPSENDIVNINKIIHNYVKINKRKIYGGYGLDLLVKNKGKKLYDDTSILKTPDIDCYSHEPVKDLINICNLLDDAGFKYVMGKEAMHKETYSISVNMKLFCDITYVPVNIIKKIPFNIVNGYYVTAPLFMSIDYLRMLSDPITSYWRIQKAVERFSLLTECYPLNDIIKKHPNIKIDEKYISDEYNNATNNNFDTNMIKTIDTIIETFLQNNDSCVTVGLSIIKFFIHQVNVFSGTTFKDIVYHEIISTNYVNNVNEIIELLFSSDLKQHVSYEEHQPFFQFTGKSMHIKYDDVTILKIYSSNNKSIPYQYHNNMKIGTYSLVLKSLLVELMVNRTINNKHMMSTYYHIVEYFVNLRQQYFELNPEKNVFSESLFKEFSLDCIGNTFSPELERKHLIEQRKKTKAKLTFVYEPKEKQKNPSDESYFFANSSGNKINKSKNKDIDKNEKKIDENIIIKKHDNKSDIAYKKYIDDMNIMISNINDHAIKRNVHVMTRDEFNKFTNNDHQSAS